MEFLFLNSTEILTFATYAKINPNFFVMLFVVLKPSTIKVSL